MARRRMGACETTPPATNRGTPPTLHTTARTEPFLALDDLVAARRRPARSSSPLCGCGRSSRTPPARQQDPGSCEEDPEEQSGQPGDTTPGHRVNFLRPLDTSGPHGWVPGRRLGMTEQGTGAGGAGPRGGWCCRRPWPGVGVRFRGPGEVGSRSARRGRVVARRIKNLN
jgi:hypothetical protein